MYDLNSALIAAILFASMAAVIELGYRIGHRRRHHGPEPSKERLRDYLALRVEAGNVNRRFDAAASIAMIPAACYGSRASPRERISRIRPQPATTRRPTR